MRVIVGRRTTALRVSVSAFLLFTLCVAPLLVSATSPSRAGDVSAAPALEPATPPTHEAAGRRAAPAAGPRAGRSLSFEDRLDCQRAIERVYYRHQVGTTEPLDRAVPDVVIQSKVRSHLRQSVALEERWGTRITSEALRREMERIIRDTRFPDRLAEIAAALNDDPVLLQECLARPILVDRLALARFEADEEIGKGASSPNGRGPRSGWDEWWSEAQGSFDESRARTVAETSTPLPAVASLSPSCVPDDTWDNGVLPLSAVATESATAVWTGTEMIVFGGLAGSAAVNLGRRYDPLIDRWRVLPAAGAPGARYLHTAIWTGSEMIVWGGTDGTGNLGTGGRYDPVADAWTPIATGGAPQARSRHSAVWTGSRMVIWGGEGSQTFDTGGLYDPVTDSWEAVTRTRAPSRRHSHTAIWTGDRMIVWGGRDGSSILSDGASYDPPLDRWSSISSSGAPAARGGHTAAWTGATMIVWGGAGATGVLQSGGRYNVSSDQWSSTSLSGAAQARERHTAVWTGSRMLLWGGKDAVSYFAGGSRYDPVADSWSLLSAPGGPGSRYGHTAVWTGDLMIIWGGVSTSQNGGKYDPIADAWTPVSSGAPPAPRAGHVSVWTGNVMIVFGGYGPGVDSTGGRYDPLTDSWSATSTLNAPSGAEVAVWTGHVMLVWGGQPGSQPSVGWRYDSVADAWRANAPSYYAPAIRQHVTAVWTGSEMIIYGGVGSDTRTGIYNPATDTWRLSTLSGSDEGKSAVWTGTRMIVWGGRHYYYPNYYYHNSGIVYDPATDTWTLTSLVGAPSPRFSHAAVWTGSRMIVWGGYEPTGVVGDGALYDPTTDAWTPVSIQQAPQASGMYDSHLPAVWTGREMVVWRGQGSGNTAGRYDPVNDSWVPVSQTSEPEDREEYTSVWTGSFMMVWGGRSYQAGHPLFDTGGRYALGHAGDDDGDGVAECAGDCNDGSSAVYPGAAETCDGLDNDCDALVDEGFDADGDGVSICGGDCDEGDPQRNPFLAEVCDGKDNDCSGVIDDGPDPDFDGSRACDCAPGNSGVFASPPEITNLNLAPALELGWVISWDSAHATAGSATVHDVLRGSIGDLPVNGAITEVCLVSGQSGNTISDPDMPPPGTAFYYVVRGRNICAYGTYGFTSAGAPRNSPACP